MKAVIYARVSTTDQETQRQVNELKDHAKVLGLEVVEIFTEKISGTTKQSSRPAFSALQTYVTENDVHHVICHELSRIGRNLRHTVNIIYDFMDQGICIHTKSENIQTLNPDGTKNNDALFRVGIFGSIAQMEVETMRARIKSGLRNSKLNGGANGAGQPYGFESIDRKLTVNEQEAEIVRDMYNRYLRGDGFQAIAVHLNETGIPSKKQTKWVSRTIRNILKNPIYKGERYHNGEQVPYDLEIIVPFEKWEKVQSMVNNKSPYKHRKSKNINLLKGLIFCGNCGLPMYLHKNADHNHNTYKCLSTKKDYSKIPCGLRGINIDMMNKIALYYSVFSPSFDFAKLQSESEKVNAELNLKIENLKVQVESLNKELTRLTSTYMKGTIKEPIFEQLYSETDGKISDAEAKIERYKRQIRVAPEKPKDLTTLSGETLSGEFQKFIDSIRVFNVSLVGTPFNQRKDNNVYKLVITTRDSRNHIVFTSSRDQRLFAKGDGVIDDFADLNHDLKKIKKIEI